MKLLTNESIVWESENKETLLTSHRLRTLGKSLVGHSIKSIMLEDLNGCELNTNRRYRLLWLAIVWFLLPNFAVYFYNQYLVNALLVKIFIGEETIGATWASTIFYASLVTFFTLIVLFFLTVRRVFSFHSSSMTIQVELRWLSFEERESFISMVEEAKNQREIILYKG